MRKKMVESRRQFGEIISKVKSIIREVSLLKENKKNLSKFLFLIEIVLDQ